MSEPVDVEPGEGVPAYRVTTFREPRHRYALVIPVLNEGDRIRRQLAALNEAGVPADVYLADGGSTDGSTAPAELSAAGVTALLVKTGPGRLSAQLRMGFHHVLGLPYDGVVTMDGNGKDGVEGVARIVAALESGLDFVQGSRFVRGGTAENTPLVRHLGVVLVHAPVTSLAARHRFTDTTNGFRGHSRRLLVDPRVAIFRDVFDTYELLAYLPIRAARLGYRVGEVPVARRYPASGSTPTKIHGLSGNAQLLRVLAKAATHQYDPAADPSRPARASTWGRVRCVSANMRDHHEVWVAARSRARIARIRRIPARVRRELLMRLEEKDRADTPANFADWNLRREGSREPDFPSGWRYREDLPLRSPSRICVVLHVHYPELIPSCIAPLRNIPVEYDLLVTNSSGLPEGAGDFSGCQARNIRILDVDNRGRDLWPLIQLVNSGLLDPYEVVLKVHTKKSPWRASHKSLLGSGSGWAADLLRGIAGDGEVIRTILSAFASDATLGLVTAQGNILGEEYWGSNRVAARELLRRVELDIACQPLGFAAGSMYWVRGFLLQGLRALNFTAEDFEDERGQADGTTAHAVERILGILTQEAGLGLRSSDNLGRVPPDAWRRYLTDADLNPVCRFVPFYLPQYHPIPENDRWWGRGFTEWANVASAKPVFRGHVQPNLPSELGFYDLRLDEVRNEQARLAVEHSIGGFMYYYYWFAGRRVLQLPIDRLVAGDASSEFCIMWANENWTAAWDGGAKDVLIGQDYEAKPAAEFIEDILPLVRDPRYLRVDGRAVVAVYRPAQIPDLPDAIGTWRKRVRDEGLGELMLLAVDVAEVFDGLGAGYSARGFDGALGFPPHKSRQVEGPVRSVGLDPRFHGALYSYRATVDAACQELAGLGEHEFPGVMVGFDKTPRRQWDADVWYGANPYTFRRWLAHAAARVGGRSEENRIVFINAWNEWAEGAVLEPTVRFGRTFLQAVRDVARG